MLFLQIHYQLIILGYGVDVPSCTLQAPCLTVNQGACVNGMRTVCLGTNAAGAGCTLGADTIDAMCSVPNNVGKYEICFVRLSYCKQLCIQDRMLFFC